MKVLLNLIPMLLQRILSALTTWSTTVYVLRKLAKRTDNLIDDNVIEIVDAAKNNDSEKIALYAQKLIDATLAELEKKKTS